MQKRGKFDWSEFIRLAIGISIIGVGIALVGNSAGRLLQLIFGFILIGIGIAIIMNK